MALLPLLLVLILAVLLGAAIAVAARRRPSPEVAVAAARAHAVRSAAAAGVLGVVAAAAVAVSREVGGPGPRAAGVLAELVPVTFGIVHTAVLLVGELTWPRPAGEIRRARLVHRRPLGTAAPWLRRLAAGTVALAALTLVAGTLLADPDGRSVSRVGGTGTVATQAGPFPGSVYSVPAAVGLAVLACLALATLVAVASRPAVVTGDDRVEEALRRASGHRVLRGATAAALVTVGGLLLTGGGAVRSIATDPAAPGLAAAGWGVLALGLACAITGLVLACLPAPRVPAPGPTAVPA